MIEKYISLILIGQYPTGPRSTQKSSIDHISEFYRDIYQSADPNMTLGIRNILLNLFLLANLCAMTTSSDEVTRSKSSMMNDQVRIQFCSSWYVCLLR